MIPLVGLFGPAGAGKGTVARMLREAHGAEVISLVDPAKRFCHKIFGWDEATLWGDSALRDVVDRAFVGSSGDGLGWRFDEAKHDFLREIFGHAQMGTLELWHWFDTCRKTACSVGLTARDALDDLGIDFARRIKPSVWIDYGIATARTLLRGGYTYSHIQGLTKLDDTEAGPPLVVFDNGRFRNEAFSIREAGGAVWLVAGRTRDLGDRPSETSALRLPMSLVSACVFNGGSMTDLEQEIDAAHGRTFGPDPRRVSAETILRRSGRI